MRSPLEFGVTGSVGLVDVLGISLTALVGIAGIVSTHLLARSQRSSDTQRWIAERGERYNFARYEAVAAVCAEFVGELTRFEMSANLRQGLAGGIKNRIRTRMPEMLREKAEITEDAEVARELRARADQFDSDPDMALSRARGEGDGEDFALPPRVEGLPVIQRLAELSARLQILGGNEIASAASDAQIIASGVALRLMSSEADGLKEPVELESLQTAIDRFITAAVYETQLEPHGGGKSLKELFKRFEGQKREDSDKD